MQSNRELDNEGEIIIQFESRGKSLYSVTFSIVPGRVLGSATQDSNVILISRMQGKAGAFAAIRSATKAMGEVAPRAVLIHVLQGIAAAIDIRTIVGVSAANQLSSETSDAKAFHRAYDQVFQSIGAIGPNEGFYSFDAPLPERPLARGHRGRKQTKRDFKQTITRTTTIAWRNAIAPEGACDPAAEVIDTLAGL